MCARFMHLGKRLTLRVSVPMLELTGKSVWEVYEEV